MQNIDMIYFNEYKSAEKLCNEIYGEKGVSVYIETMEATTCREKNFIVGWNEYYKTLKHLRWLRNQIAHENGTYEVTDKDVSDIKRFYSDLLSGQDPLTLLRKEIENSKRLQQEQKNRMKSQQKAKEQPIINSEIETPKKDGLLMAAVIAVAVIGAALVIGFLFLR